MNDLYLDGSAGLSGDMFLGALLDLGIPPARFKRDLARLRLPVTIGVRRVRRGALSGLKVDVRVRGGGSAPRTFEEISALIRKSRFPASVRNRGLEVFRTLFQAEAKVHGRPFRKAHLHEAGADDALVDILGTCSLLEALEVKKIYCSPLNLGSGWVESGHGVLPVPPPAVAELLKGVPVYAANAEAELVTPTGAALAVVLVSSFGPLPEFRYDRIGYGAGGRDLPGFPNVLRIFCGRSGASDRPASSLYVLETHIDDSTPEVLAAFLDKALEIGALDAALTPIVMKKGRLATKLTLLAEADRIDDLVAGVFRETSSIGVRFYPVERRTLDRVSQTAHPAGESVAVKTARFQGRTVTVHPEFEDCLRTARKTGLPLKDVQRRAEDLVRRKERKR